MKAFVSDIHLGDGSKADDFHRDQEFIDFIRWTDNKCSEIVILGDLYELWQADLQDILWAHPNVVKVLEHRRHKITFVHGNHDFLPYSRLVSNVYTTPYIWAEHGHAYDKFNKETGKKNPLFQLKWPIGRYITLAVAELERWVSPNADIWLEKQRQRFGNFLVEAALLQNKEWDKSDSDQVRVKVNKLKKVFNDRPVSVMGHTHQPEVSKIKVDHLHSSFIYANCGTWVDGDYPTFITVEDGGAFSKDILEDSRRIVVQLRDGLDCNEVLEEEAIYS
jgi:UDP-2,3-diacylglucosamine pyrophosphatase LpxH